MSTKRSPLKKQLWKVAYAKNSFCAAKSTCAFILSNSKRINRYTYRVLTVGFSVIYARPFGPNRGVGALDTKFGKFTDARMQNTHEAILMARDKLLAHTDADCKYYDETGKEKEELLRLEVVVAPPQSDGHGVARTRIYVPEVPLANLPIYQSLCEELLRRLGEEENRLMLKLYGHTELSEGVNTINIFDET